MNQEFSRTHWIWLIPAIPLLLMLLLIAAAYLFPYKKGDPYLIAGMIIFGISTLVGLGMLVTILILRFKHKISLAQPRLWLSIALTFLNLAIPISIVTLVLYALSEVAHH